VHIWAARRVLAMWEGTLEKDELVETGVPRLRVCKDVLRAEWDNLGRTALPLTGAVVNRPVLGTQRTSASCDSTASTLFSCTPVSSC